MPITNPTDIASLHVWYDADDAASFTFSSGVLASQWNDKSGGGRHLVQATVSNQPARNGSLNGRTTVVFDGSNDCMVATFTELASPNTVAVVAKLATDTWRYIFEADNVGNFGTAMLRNGGATTNQRWRSGTDQNVVVDGGWHLLVGVFGTSGQQRVDGVQVSTLNTGTDGFGPDLHMGSATAGSECLLGEIAEFVAYDALLSAGEIADLEAYLNSRWFTVGPAASARLILSPPGRRAPTGVLSAWTGSPASEITAIDLLVDNAVHAHTADNLDLAEVHDLVVADAVHAHTADNITLTEVYELVVADAVHAHTADNLTLTQVHQLVVADATHAHTADTITLPHNLIVQDALHGPAGWVDLPGTTGNNLSTPDAPELDIIGDICIVALIAPDDWTGAGNQTIVAKWTAGQLSYWFMLGTSSALNIFWSADGTAALGMTTGVTPDVVNGEWKWVAVTLDVDNGASGRTARFWRSDDGTNWALIPNPVTTPNATSIHPGTSVLRIGSTTTTANLFAGRIGHVSIRDGIGTAGTVGGTEVFRFNAATDLAGVNLAGSTFTATTGQTVTVNRSGSPATELLWFGGHTADNITLTQVHNLTVADAVHVHSADALTLTQVHDLTVADGSHAHTADNLTLTQVHNLVVADAVHAHTADNVVLASSITLAVDDASHGHTADALTLTQVHVLTVADGQHSHTADNVTLTQVHHLAVDDATHAHTADNVVLGAGAVLEVADGLHAHSADQLTLTQVHNLVISDGLHAHTADNLTLTQVHVLEVADGLHGHSADNVTLTGGSVLAVNDASHSHSADHLTLTQVHVLHVNGCVHNHTADGPLTLTQVHQLVVADCLHSHTAEAITLGIPPTGAPSRSRVWRVLADDRVLAPIHDRIIHTTPSPTDDRELTPGHDRTIRAPANTRTIGVTP